MIKPLVGRRATAPRRSDRINSPDLQSCCEQRECHDLVVRRQMGAEPANAKLRRDFDEPEPLRLRTQPVARLTVVCHRTMTVLSIFGRMVPRRAAGGSP